MLVATLHRFDLVLVEECKFGRLPQDALLGVRVVATPRENFAFASDDEVVVAYDDLVN